MNSPRKRLDALLVERGLASGRERAKEQIRAGHVRVDGRPETKPSTLVNAGAVLICEGGCPYVGRGGLKLEKAVREAPLALAGLTALDIGASTGGFTDCMLQNGAVRVYTVDVGHGQLHASLCEDPRVICLEGTDARSRELAAAVPAGTVPLSGFHRPHRTGQPGRNLRKPRSAQNPPPEWQIRRGRCPSRRQIPGKRAPDRCAPAGFQESHG